MDEETGEQIITVCQEVKYKDVVQGVVAMDIDASALADYVENIRLLNTGFVMLVDEQGNIVVDSESNTFADGTVADLEFFAPLTEELDKLEEQKAQLEENEGILYHACRGKGLCHYGDDRPHYRMETARLYQ